MSAHRILLALAAGLAVLTAVPASSRAYVFVSVADTSGAFAEFGDPPAISAAGTVAFRAFPKTGGYGIFTIGGETIADQTGFSGIGFLPSINAVGTVAFIGSQAPGELGVFAGNGEGQPVPITNQTGPIESRLLSAIGNAPSINGSGTVAFQATYTAGGSGVFTGSGAGLTTVYDTSGPFSGFGSPVLDDAGTLAFLASLDAGGTGVFTGSGGPTTPIADTSGPISGFGGGLAIGAAGTVAFAASLDAGGSGVFAGSGGPLTPVADSSGPFSSFGPLAINDAGTIAFQATLDAGGSGIFTGPDAVADEVIKIGDPLFGSALAFFSFHRGLDDDGNVAFFYRLDTGVSGIAVALVPEPGGGAGAAAAALSIVAVRRRGRSRWRSSSGRRAPITCVVVVEVVDASSSDPHGSSDTRRPVVHRMSQLVHRKSSGAPGSGASIGPTIRCPHSGHVKRMLRRCWDHKPRIAPTAKTPMPVHVHRSHVPDDARQ